MLLVVSGGIGVLLALVFKTRCVGYFLVDLSVWDGRKTLVLNVVVPLTTLRCSLVMYCLHLCLCMACFLMMFMRRVL